jgi:hypothetical protein
MLIKDIDKMILIYPRAFDMNTNRPSGPVSYEAGIVPWMEASLGLPVDFNFKICARIYPLQTTLMCDRVL